MVMVIRSLGLGLGLGLAAAAAVAAAAPAAAAPALPVTHYRLDNGLEVILQPDPSVTSAVVQVWYHVGSRDEVKGKSGFAHLFEHLMFEGSRHVGEGQFDRLLETAGGWNNGSTDYDRTNYYEQVPGNFLPLALWLEADRMVGLWDAMNERVLTNQRDVVKNERRESYENRPYGAADLAIQQALWPEGHPYHGLTIGTMVDLDAAALGDVERFWRTWYLPSNATLVVVGGIDVDATRALIATYFGWMPKQARPPRPPKPAVEPRPEPARLDLRDRVSVPKVLVSWRADATDTAATADLELAAHLLGGGKTSRLYRRLVMKDRLATAVWVDHGAYLLGGELHVHAIAREGASPDQLLTAIREEVAAIRDRDVGAAELERARRTLEAQLLTSLENLATRASALAQWAAYTGDPDHLAEELARRAAVTPASLRATAARWLADGAAVTTVVMPGGGS